MRREDERASGPESGVLPAITRPARRVFVRAAALAAKDARREPARPRPPGSKYYTLRYLLNALLADGESVVRNPALSDDTAALVGALRALGASAAWVREPREAEEWALRVRGVAGRPSVPPGGVISVGNAGAVLRLLLGIGALLPEVRFETDHPDSLGRRPNRELLDALAALGIPAAGQGPEGLLPITLRGGPPSGGTVSVSGARSSQYLSALLYLAPLLPRGLAITVTDGLRSAPLVWATLRALAAAGIAVDAAEDLSRFVVPGHQRYRAGVYDVPGDGPSAAALVAAGLAVGAPLRLERLDTREDDVRALLAALAALGAPVTLSRMTGGVAGLTTLELAAAGRLHGAVIDGDACIDSVPSLVAAACFAEGESRFENVANLRLKESDRIGDLCAELRRAGCDVEPEPDAIVVRGRPEGIAGGVTVEGHDDHRLAQALAVVALRSRDGLTLAGADAVAKSFPWFFDDLRLLGAEVTPLGE